MRLDVEARHADAMNDAGVLNADGSQGIINIGRGRATQTAGYKPHYR